MNSNKYHPVFIVLWILLLGGCDRIPAVSINANTVSKGQFVLGNEPASVISALTEIGVCSLENIMTISDGALNANGENRFLVKKGGFYKLIGFATDVKKGLVQETFKIVLVGDKIFWKNGVAGLERPDVAEFFKKPTLAEAGYQIDVGFENVDPGDYSVFLLNDGSTTITMCPTHQIITVK